MGLIDSGINRIIRDNKIAIICHTAPDTDAIASLVALKKLIKQNLPEELLTEKQINLFVDAEEINEIDSAMLKNVEYNVQNCDLYDLAISVDCASSSRMGKYEELYNSAKFKINIDHHSTNTKFGDINLVLNASSTCEALYILSKLRKFKISDEVCNLIYSGIITDTNNLTQGTITKLTHKTITEMVERNINTQALHDHFFKNNTKSKAYLLQKALSSMRFYAKDKIVLMKITNRDMHECDATFDDTLGIVNHGIDIKGVEIAILAIRKEDNSYYVSLRSKNNVQVNEIATSFGGGGHDQVAAFQYNGTYFDLQRLLIGACKEELDKHHSDENIVENLFLGDDDESANIYDINE